MHRATILYIAMAAALIGALGLIVHLGGRNEAPRDFSGAWTLSPSDARVGASSSPSSMLLEQSGRHVRVSFDKGPNINLVLTETRPPIAGATTSIFENGDRRLELTTSALNPNTPASAASGVFTDPDGRRQFEAKKSSGGGEAATARGKPGAPAPHNRLFESPLGLLIVQVLLILALSRLMGVLFAKFHQPQVVGEMFAGILLGPSLFGALFPNVSAMVFPPQSIVSLNSLSQIGVIFFLFLIGLELDPKLIRNRGHAAVVISHVSIVAPFILGTGLTLYLYHDVFNSQMRYLSVALFMGASMSITAFPVLARILTERNLHKTPVGAITITCAAVDDVTAWCMLAFVVAVARATGVKPALITAVASVIYVAVMFWVVRPLLRRIQLVHERQGKLGQNVVALICLLTLASAYVTEIIGIHALFGAFLMGAIMPKGTQFVRTLSEKLEDYTVVLLLPLFFAYTGLKTQIGLLNTAALWLDTGLIIFVACLGKFGGSSIAARACGLGWRESSVIGILMNTRGLMELVILNIGRELGVISPAVFAMMVIMALVTTAMTTPVLQLVGNRGIFGKPARPKREPRKAGIFSILIPVADPRSGGPLLHLAEMLAGPAESGGKLLALHLSRPVDRDAYRSGLDEPARNEASDPLRPMLEHASKSGVAVEPLEFVSRDIPADIARVADEQHADLVLMGFHKSVIGRTVLGGTVHRVMTGTPADVAVFVDRGFKGGRKIMVPYLGGRHDRLALELAARLGRQAEAQVTVLHIVAPNRRAKSEQIAVKATERAFGESGQSTPVHVRIIESASPVQAVLDSGKDFDVVIIGVSEEWGLSSQLFGWRPERIAEGLTTSLLIVRHHGERPADEADERLRSVPQTPQPVIEPLLELPVAQMEAKPAQD